MIAKRSQVKVKNPKRIRRHLQWSSILRKLFFVVFGLGFIVTATWTVFFSNVMQVDQINIANNRLDRSELESLIKSDIEGKLMNIFPKSNLLLIPREKIENDIRQKFKLVRNVKVQRVFPKAILVEIEERSSVLVWCHSGDCYLVDETGTAFYKLKPDDQELQDESLIKVEDQSQTNFSLGSKILEEKTVRYYLDIFQKMKQYVDIEAESWVSTPSSMSGEVTVKAKDGWQVILNIAEPLDNQMEILRRILDEKIGKTQLAQLEYIDLRLKGRAVYRLKSVETDQTENQETTEPELPDKQSSEPTKKDDKKNKANT